MILFLAILNACIGLYFIQRGIKKKGKKVFLNDNGYYYIGWVAISTIILMTKATV